MSNRVQWRGVTLDERTRAQLIETERVSGLYVDPVQGSYSTGVSASAGTHAGGGAVDLAVDRLNADQRYRLVKTLRVVGFAAWLRPYRDGVWSAHIHAVSIGCPDLAPLAVGQVNEYRLGGDGLKGTGPDPHRSMRVPFRTWEQYLAARDGLTRIARVAYGDRNESVKLLRDRLRTFITKHEGYAVTKRLDPEPHWDRFDKQLSALIWQAHKTLARLTGNPGWRALRNDIPGEALLARLGLTTR